MVTAVVAAVAIAVVLAVKMVMTTCRPWSVGLPTSTIVIGGGKCGGECDV